MRTAAAGPLRWQLTDAVGRRLLGAADQLLPAGTSTVPLPGVAGLATGVYLLQVPQGARQQTLKLVRE